ncbi:YolD-like family protein [Lederbergia galactosidilytica]|uniref:YolD-like family protein n=1 Tax=Lederbergia galactosidilytica TaxID=217031 RepID=UPI000FFED4F2|nr:YolD-like family protein [Lederbergia galactosidilytica]
MLTAGHNLMWESSRMMLPEHVECILDWRKSLDEEKKPIIDEQQWEEFGQTIQEAIANNQRVKFTIWKDGFFEDVKGWVHNIDPQL